MLLADIDKWNEAALYLKQFLTIFLISIFQMLEYTSGIHVVAGIDAHLLTVAGCHISYMSIEMYVGHQRRRIAIGFKSGRDMLHVLCLTCALCGESHQFTARIDDTLSLSYTPFRIVGIYCGHRLDADRCITADGEVANMYLISFSSLIHGL